jgi:hypothetical protein
MTRFVGALALLLAWSGVQAKGPSLASVARHAAKTNPKLVVKEKERKRALNEKVRSLAVPRSLDQAAADAVDDKYDWEQAMAQDAFGFDITTFSMKYAQCATVESYSDLLAEDEYSDTVLAAQRFAIFRLCPADQCSSKSNNGCDNSYGEYLVSMDQYLSAVFEEQEGRVYGYCEYCQQCATIESAKAFYTEVASRREAAITTAEANYEEWYNTYVTAYAETQAANAEANGYNNANEQGDDSEVAQRYYTYVKDKTNYANTYYQANYGSSGGYSASSSSASASYSASSQPQWDSSQFWQYQQSSTKQYSNKNSWSSMGSSFATYFGQTIVNGYFDENGDFNEGWGYFNCNGEFIGIEDDGGEWDECVFGEQPDGWNDVADDTESCNFEYASSCYNQYDACMTILQDEEYLAYTNPTGYGDVLTMKDFVECTGVDVSNSQGTVYSNQDYYAQQYKSKQEYFNTQYNCYDGDEDCYTQRDYAMKVWSYQQSQKANRQYYIGPHCDSNGRDITLAVYKDEYCSVLDTETTIKSLLGYSLADTVDLVPDECIACGVVDGVSKLQPFLH